MSFWLAFSLNDAECVFSAMMYIQRGSAELFAGVGRAKKSRTALPGQGIAMVVGYVRDASESLSLDGLPPQYKYIVRIYPALRRVVDGSE